MPASASTTLRGPAAELAGEPDDLARADGEADRLDKAGREQAFDPEQRFPAERAARREHGLEVAAEHHGDDRVDVELGGRARGQAAAVAEHRDAVGDAEHLGQAVRHVDDAAPLGGEPLDHGQDALDLAVGERRGRLVEDQDAGVADEQPRDLEELHLGDAQPLDRRARVEMVEADGGEQLSRARVEPPRQPERRHAGLAEDQVLGDRQRRHGAVLLVDDRDARRLRAGARVELGRPRRRSRSCPRRARRGRREP